MPNSPNLNDRVFKKMGESFHKLSGIISHYIGAGIPIPSPLVAELNNLIKKTGIDKSNELWKTSETLAIEAFKHLEKRRFFHYNWKYHASKEIIPVKSSTVKLFKYLIEAYLMYRKARPSVNVKLKTAAWFYEKINHQKSMLTEEETKRLTHGRITALAGILTHVVGFPVTGKDNPTMDDFFQGVKNGTKKYLKGK